MTNDEISRLAQLLGYADNACPNCVHDLVEHANRLFPELFFQVLPTALIQDEDFNYRIPVTGEARTGWGA